MSDEKPVFRFLVYTMFTYTLSVAILWYKADSINESENSGVSEDS